MPRTARVWADLRAERVERLEQHGEDAKLPSSTRCEEPAKQTGYLRVEIKGDVCGGQAVRRERSRAAKERSSRLCNADMAYCVLCAAKTKLVPCGLLQPLLGRLSPPTEPPSPRHPLERDSTVS